MDVGTTVNIVGHSGAYEVVKIINDRTVRVRHRGHGEPTIPRPAYIRLYTAEHAVLAHEPVSGSQGYTLVMDDEPRTFSSLSQPDDTIGASPTLSPVPDPADIKAVSQDTGIVAGIRERLRSVKGDQDDDVTPRLEGESFRQSRADTSKPLLAQRFDENETRLVAVAFFPFLDGVRIPHHLFEEVEDARLTNPDIDAIVEKARRAVRTMLAAAHEHAVEAYEAFYEHTLTRRHFAPMGHDEIRAAIVSLIEPNLPDADKPVLEAFALAAHPWLGGPALEAVAAEMRVTHNVGTTSPYDTASDRLLRLAEAVRADDPDASRHYEQAANDLIDANRRPAVPSRDPDDPLAVLDSLVTDPFGIEPSVSPSPILRDSTPATPSIKTTKMADVLVRAAIRSGQIDLGAALGDKAVGVTVRDAIHCLGASTPAERLREALDSFDDRDRDLLVRRVLAPKGNQVTYAEIGETWGLTRERIRQLCKQLAEGLDGTNLRAVIHPLSNMLRAARPMVTAWGELYDRALVLADGDADLVEPILGTTGPWNRTDNWVWHHSDDNTVQGAIAAIRAAADDYDIVDEATVVERCPSTLVREGDLSAFLASHKIQRVGSLYAVGATLTARVAAALRHIGRPATKEAITALLPEDNPRSAGNVLSSIDGIVRADKARWGFEEWVDDVYDGIPGEIDQRIAEHGGAVTLDLLLDEIPNQFGVSEASVRAYVSTAAYTITDGVVRQAEAHDFHALDPAEVPNAELSDTGWGQVVRLTADNVERGYSLTISAHVAHANGIRIGDSVRVPLNVVGPGEDEAASLTDHAEASVIWRATTLSGGTEVGRTAGSLRDHGFNAGDYALVVPTPAGVTILHRLGPKAASSLPASVAPHYLTVTVGAHQEDLPVLTSKNGNAWFATAIDGKYAHAGVRIAAAGDEPLPVHVHVGGTQLPFGPVPKYDKDAGGYITDEFEDFDRTRLAEGDVMVNGHGHTARVKVTRRSNGGWHLTAKVYPKGGEALTPPEPSTKDQDEPARSNRHRETNMETEDRPIPNSGDGPLSRILRGPSI